MKIPWSSAGTTNTLQRGPQTWTNAGSSHESGRVSATRAWIASTAARGTLSWSPAQATCLSVSGV